MAALATDPLDEAGIAGFAHRLRAGTITAEATTRAYLDRIKALNPALDAYECVTAEAALATARALDALLAAGTDLGPLMGVPVAIKDLFAVTGTPTTVGSNLDLADAIGPEGTFVKSLRRAGCVILGKTRMPEFAMGSVGGRGCVTHLRGCPRNPWDAKVTRAPGASSSGSAVAVAAGLSAFAIGTDTGGSIRGPAAMCGVFGLKASPGRWPVDGMFPQAPELDSLGPMTRTAADAALIHAALTGEPAAEPAPPRSLRLARPTNHVFDELDDEVARCVDAALAALGKAGVTVVPVAVPELDEIKRDFGAYVPASLIAIIGRERFLAQRHRMDPLVTPRIAAGLEVRADHWVRLEARRRALARAALSRMAGFDGWVMPTAAMVAPPLDIIAGRSAEDLTAELAARRTHRRMAVNYFGLCASSTPIQMLGATLPVGLQVVCPCGEERSLLAIALALEAIFGPPPRPDLTGFL